MSACGSFGNRRRSPDGQEPLDLTETLPITSADRFVGDAAGILGTAMALHGSILPLLALAVALSPLPTATFFAWEGMTLAIVVFMSAGASWNLHANPKWRTRHAGNLATFLVLAAVILRLTTRGQTFADAAWFYFVEPSRHTWRAVAASITNPAMLLASMALLYFGFIGYYAVQSVRHLERR